ncbi:hypothetical protein K3495_g3833 [Podosphaera aphanis]|nr:hypothetical protein K3495_g3833 [Podosphaera aphanis]
MKLTSNFTSLWTSPVGRLSVRGPTNHLRQLTFTRHSSQSKLGTLPPTTKRKSINILNDNGLVPWSELSGKERVARLTQQTINLSLIAVGAALSGGVVYFMYTNVFSPESNVSHYNRAFDQVIKDPRCIALLGDAQGITAFGESFATSRRKSKPNVASHTQTDSSGIEHLYMKFNINGTKSDGIVSLHMTRRPSEKKFVYEYLTLSVPGNHKIYLENAGHENSGSRKKFRLFGVNWN